MPQALMFLGPTASGKSAFSLRLARTHAVEIISLDSALVYRGLDIGSAKPSLQELAVCPHHLINIREIDEPYSAANFVSDCVALVDDIRARGATPLIVGGTMLYAKALRDGLNDMPATPVEVREAVQREAATKGWPAMLDALRQVDPITASRLAPMDKQRIGRALEVFRTTGKPLSAFHERSAEPALETAVFGLLPADRAALHRRIEERFLKMLEDGFLDEVERLMKHPRFDRESPAMRAVGYRQAVSFLKGECDRASFIAAGVAATRQLAKRQMTWMRSMADIRLVDPFSPDAYERFEAWAEQKGVRRCA